MHGAGTLSEDVLLEIFNICSEAERCGEWPRTNIDWDWTSITHISRYWRNIAISSPILWCRPILARHSQDRLVTFLRRSRDAPLTIYATRDCKSVDPASKRCEKCKDALIRALQHIHRIRYLHIDLLDLDLVDAMLDRPAPLLEELHLRVDPVISWHHFISLPDSFLGSYTPLLRKLEMSGCYLPYSSTIFRDLRVLRVTDECNSFYHPFESRERHYPTISDLFDILKLSSELTELKLSMLNHTFAQDGGHKDYSLHEINLPLLKLFEVFKIDTDTCINSLRCLRIPTDAVLSFGFGYSDMNDTPGILTILEDISSKRLCNSLDLRLLGCYVDAYIEADTTREMKSDIFIRKPNYNISLRNIGEGWHNVIDTYEGITAFVIGLIHGSHWKDVTSLQIQVTPDYTLDEQQWRTLLSSFGSLENLDISVEMNTDKKIADCILLENRILSVLTYHTVQDTVILPCLRRLHITVSSIIHISKQTLQCMRARKEYGFTVYWLLLNLTDHCYRDWFNTDEHREVGSQVDYIDVYSGHC